METEQTTQLPITPPLELAPAPAFQHCDDCRAPVDHDQRYCVNCGAHRRQVTDPAARYLTQASARSRVGAGAVASRGAGTRRRGASLASAVVLALIPVAAAIGVEVGRSSGSQDSKLIQELARERAQTIVSGTPSSTTGGGTRAGSKSVKAGKKGAKSTKSASTAGGGKVVSKTQYGAATQITGSKVTAGDQAQGAAEAKNIQNSTGKNYVQAANNLPTTVVP